MGLERTFIMLKPDAVQRGLIGTIITRFEQRGLKLVAMKLIQMSEELAHRHYAEHKGKSFYGGLVKHITSGPVVPMVVEGDNAVAVVRAMMGATDPQDSAPGTIRGDFALQLGKNIIHGADSRESAEREIKLFFEESEFVEYTRCDEKWIYEY
jgi:nucleoside-diphosphate kinase